MGFLHIDGSEKEEVKEEGDTQKAGFNFGSLIPPVC